MKSKMYAVLVSCALALSLAACGSSSSDSSSESEEAAEETEEAAEEEAEEEEAEEEEAAEEVSAETLTGTATGFGGDVTVTLTMEGDMITDCTIDGPDETETIGGAALEELAEQVVAANGPEIDGVSGASVTSNAVSNAVSAALGLETEEETEEEAEEEAEEEEIAEEPAEKVDAPEGSIQIGAAYGAPHGTQAFAVAIVAVQDGAIIGTYVDEFQFVSTEYDVVGVPNSDSDFAESFAEDTILISKRVNSEFYSSVMAANGGATIAYDENMDAVQDYITGLSIDETLELADDENAVDAISGATLADTANYAALIAEAADNAQYNQYVEYDGSAEDLTLSVAYGAAHGTKCFTIAGALTDGETIVAAYVDELQFLPTDYDITPVPNSDSDFGEGYAEGMALCSKRVNTAFYSSLMASSGGATIDYDVNMDAVQAYVSGMSIPDAEELAADEAAVDAVSGATLEDTANYVALIVEAAQQ